MGLLDDAIREHLELKRRHGAPDEEIQRQEHEALGPIRRRGEPEPAAPSDVAAVPAGTQPGDAAASGAPLAAEVVQAEEATGIVAPPPVEPADEQPVAPEPPGHEPVVEDFPAAEGPAAVPAGPTNRGASFIDDEPWFDDSPETPPSDVLEPTDETADRPASAAGPGDPAQEDVLEETPDFLQETPEHDRLWFEQRPPRGFDFEQ